MLLLHLQTIFIAVNFEEDGNQTAESQANDDDAMMRSVPHSLASQPLLCMLDRYSHSC